MAGAVLAAKYWPNDGVTLRARRSRPRRWLSRTVVEARVQSVAISIASPFTMRASKHLCRHGGGRQAVRQPEPDLRALIEAAHVGDEGVNEIAKAARRGRAAVEARQQVLVVRHRGTSPRRELTHGG